MTTPLDFVRYQFFTEDGRHLICLTHGAVYEPDSGLCVDGPCKGSSLYRLPVLVDQGEVVVGCPSGDLSFLAD
jgi:nitrite reductase/ring-hydroxylating ferredoxin subunit